MSDEQQVAVLNLESNVDDGVRNMLLTMFAKSARFDVYRRGTTNQYVISFEPEPPVINQVGRTGIGSDDDTGDDDE